MKKIFIGITLIGALAISSCNSLEVTPPNSISDAQIDQILKGDDQDKIESVLEAIGTGLEKYFNHYGTYTGYSSAPLNYQSDQEFVRSMMGNDVVMGTTANTPTGGHRIYYELSAVDNWNQKENSVSSCFWNMPVDFYIAANKALHFITPEAVAKNTSLRKNRADALVVRAWGYLLLAERFCEAYSQNPDAKGLPIYTEYRINPVAKISSLKTVYENIEEWLNEAIELYKADGTEVTPAVNDLDQGVANYLLLRTAVNFTDWATAITAGEYLVKAFPTLIPVANYGAKTANVDAYAAGTAEFNASSNAFLCAAANPEAILAFPYGALYNRQLVCNYCNVMQSGNGGAGRCQPRIDDRLYNKIAANDVRKQIFADHAFDYTYITNNEGATNTITVPQYATLKWGATTALTETVRTDKTYSDDIIFRAADAYLMLAEAYANNSEDGKAKSTLNKILAARATSGTLTCDSSMGGLSAIEMVKLQTRIEMWLERGSEYYNNKRWGIPVDRTGSTTHYNFNKLAIDQMVISVPQDEQTANPNW